MKVTTEKLPQSIVSLQIELDRDRLERGLDQAARRLSQKYPVRGFRPGKAPRFIIEQTYGRQALLEEATDDLINKAYRDVLKQEQITPVGQPSLQEISSTDPFTFRVNIPVPPTVTVGDYRAIRMALEVDPISDEQFDRALESLRDKHVVLQELDEPRPAQDGDQLRVNLSTIVPAADPEAEPDVEAPNEQTLDLVQGRLIDELYTALIGANVGDNVETQAQMPDDHANEDVRGKLITFKVEVLGMQSRLLPDWEDLPTLEEFDGSLDELRAKTRAEMEEAVRKAAERKLTDAFVEQLLESTDFDIPVAIVRDLAESMLEEQGQQFERYGITLDQMLQYRGKTRDDALDELMPEAERQTKVTLALQEVVKAEALTVDQDDFETELARMLAEYAEGERAQIEQILRSQLQNTVASAALDRKLRARIIDIVTSEAPAEAPPAEAVAETPAND